MRIAAPADRLAGALDLLERDQKSTSVPTPRSRAFAHDELGGGEVLDREAERLEDRQLVVRACGRGARRSAPRRARPRMCSGPIAPSAPRQQVVAGLVQRRLAPVDEERWRRPSSRCRARASSGCSSRRRSRGRPARASRAAGSARARWCSVQTTSAPSSVSSGVPPSPPRPRAQLRAGKDGAHRLDVRARLDAGAEDRDDRASRRGRAPRRDGRDRRGADLGDRRRVQERASSPVSPSWRSTAPWCGSRPRAGLPG